MVNIKEPGFKLSTHVWPKRRFNPDSVADLKAYSDFLKNDSWGHDGCPFHVEWPFLTVLETINHRFIYSHIDKLVARIEADHANQS